MGLKISKFHSAIHFAQDILNFGVPVEVDTGSNKSGHKKTKKAARQTQKRAKSFDEQTCCQLEEMLLLDLAKCNSQGKKMCKHNTRKVNSEVISQNRLKTSLGGEIMKGKFDNKTHIVQSTNQQKRMERNQKFSGSKI